MQNTQRILMIGAGAISREHAKAAARLTPAAELWASDPSPVAREAFAKDFPQTRFFTDAAEMLGAQSLPGDIVIVATPPWLHADQARAALLSGRHVLCEKPLAMTREEAASLSNLAAGLGLQFHCCSSRFSARPVSRDVRARLQAGEIGRRLRVRWQIREAASRSGIEYQPESRWFLDRSRAGGGCLLDWGCYDVALWTEIFQPAAITVETAWLGYPQRGPALPAHVLCNVEHQVTASLLLHLPDGRRVPLLYERASACHGAVGEVCQVEGESGALEWDWLDWKGSEIRIHKADENGNSTVECVAAAPSAAPMEDSLNFHARPLHAMLATLRGEAAAPVAGDRAASCFGVISAIYRAAESQTPQTVEFKSAIP